MLFWIISIAVTAIACAALFYAAGPRAVNETAPESNDPNSHFRLVLAGIDADVANGKLGEAEATAAKGELAREILRQQGDAGRATGGGPRFGTTSLVAGLGGIALLAFGLYAALGSPYQPSEPLAARPEVQAQGVDLDDAIARIEEQLAANPDDLRGWTVIAPAYLEMGRYADAARAFRRIIDLSEPTPDLQTSLAEALMLSSNGAPSAEAMDLLQAAAAADPTHVLSRLYIAAELTRAENYPAAVDAWQAALALSTGGESWLEAAQQGLAVAQNGGIAPADEAESAMIAQMVGTLAGRLAADGGSIEEWTQLVRAYLVLGETENAQSAYDDAVLAYPQAFDRGELDTIALSAGLTLNGTQP